MWSKALYLTLMSGGAASVPIGLNGALTLLGSECSGLALDFTDQSAVVVRCYAMDLLSGEDEGLAVDFTTATAAIKELL